MNVLISLNRFEMLIRIDRHLPLALKHLINRSGVSREADANRARISINRLSTDRLFHTLEKGKKNEVYENDCFLLRHIKTNRTDKVTDSRNV